MTGRSLSLHGALLAGYLLLAIAHTYPLVRHLATHLPGQGLGDNASFVWNGWWMREALAYLIALAIAARPPRQWTIGTTTVSLNTPWNALIVAWLLAVAAAIVRWRPRVTLARRSVVPAIARTSLAALVLFAALLAPLIAPAASFVARGDYVTQSSSLKSSPLGVDLATLVLGPPFNGVLGPFVRRAYERLGIDVMESSAWMGVGLVLLALISLRGAESTRELRRWLGVTLVFIVWALGPYLTVLTANTRVLMPQAIAHLVPLVNNARIPSRTMAVVVLGGVVVMSLALSQRRRPVPVALVITLAGLAVVESLAAPLPIAEIPPPGVYARIAADSSPGAVLTIPFGVRDGFGERGLLEHDSLLGQTIHRHPLLGGFVARLPPRVWRWYEQTEPYRTLLDLSTPGNASPLRPSCEQSTAGLKAASVAFVVVYPGDVSAALNEFVSGLPLRRVTEDAQRVLFAVDATQPGPCGRAAQ